MDHPQTPRILAPHLQNFQHRIVRMLGKVVQLRGDTAVIDAGGNVDVILNRVRSAPISRKKEMGRCEMKKVKKME
jgi:replication factor A3